MRTIAAGSRSGNCAVQENGHVLEQVEALHAGQAVGAQARGGRRRPAAPAPEPPRHPGSGCCAGRPPRTRHAGPGAPGRPRPPARSARPPAPGAGRRGRRHSRPGSVPAASNATWPRPRRSRKPGHSPSPVGQELRLGARLGEVDRGRPAAANEAREERRRDRVRGVGGEAQADIRGKGSGESRQRVRRPTRVSPPREQGPRPGARGRRPTRGARTPAGPGGRGRSTRRPPRPFRALPCSRMASAARARTSAAASLARRDQRLDPGDEAARRSAPGRRGETARDGSGRSRGPGRSTPGPRSRTGPARLRGVARRAHPGDAPVVDGHAPVAQRRHRPPARPTTPSGCACTRDQPCREAKTGTRLSSRRTLPRPACPEPPGRPRARPWRAGRRSGASWLQQYGSPTIS